MLKEMKKCYDLKLLNEDSLVWSKGMDDWMVIE
jgi:hypothetical protein